jgi:hypothetical protein
MAQSGGIPEETWDYEWDYTNGVSMLNSGWNLVSSGSGTCELRDSGQILSAATNSYRTVRNPNRFNVSSGVMEVVFYTTGINNGNEYENTRICLGNGTKGIQVCTSNGVFRLFDNNTSGLGTSLGVTVVPRQIYTLRLTLDGSFASVELDGSLLASSVGINTISYSGNTGIWSQDADWYSTYVQSVKLKLGRIN